MVCGFEPHIGLCTDSSEPGACFGFCGSLSLSLSLSAPPLLALCLSKINKCYEKTYRKDSEKIYSKMTKNENGILENTYLIHKKVIMEK